MLPVKCFLCFLLAFIFVDAVAQKSQFPSLKKGVSGKGYHKSIGKNFIDSTFKQIKGTVDSTQVTGFREKVLGEAGKGVEKGNQLIEQLRVKIKLFETGNFIGKPALFVETEHSYLNNTFGDNNGLSNYASIYSYNIQLNTLLGNIPFTFGFRGSNSGNVFTPVTNPIDNFFKFNFDPKRYSDILTAKVFEKVNPEYISSSIHVRINELRIKYEQNLRQELLAIESDLQAKLGVAFSLPPDICDLNVSDLGVMKSKLISPEELEKIKSTESRIQQLLSSKGIDSPEKDSLMEDAVKSIRKLETLEKIYSKISIYKTRFENNATVRELRQSLPFSASTFRSFLAKPGNLLQVVHQQANLSFLQQIFTRITRLDLGKNPVSGSVFELKDVINTGINTDLMGKNVGVGGILGKNNSINNWLNAGLINTVTNEYSKLAGFRFGSGVSSGFNQTISFNFYDFNDQLNQLNRFTGSQTLTALPQAARKEAVLSVRTDIPLSINQHLSVNLSKSVGNYTVTTDGSRNKGGSFNNLFGTAGNANYAGEVYYDGILLNTGFTAYFKKVGLGYSNPGNSFLRRGETSVGLGLNRRVLKERITLRYMGALKVQNFDPARNFHITTLENRWQINGKLDRYTRIGLIYQRSDYLTSFYGTTSSRGGNSRLQLDGGYRLKVRKARILSYLMMSHQVITLPAMDAPSYHNATFTLSHISSAVLGKNLLTVSVLANRSSNNNYYFSASLFNLESSYTYNWHSLRMSSGTGYYSNAGWNRQIGFKQQVSAMLGSTLSLDVDAGYKKAVSTERPELANQFYTNSYLRYHF